MLTFTFFNHKKLIFIKVNTVEIHYLKMVDVEIESYLEDIENFKNLKKKSTFDIKIKHRLHKVEYQAKVSKILEHIQRGDIYEANFCQVFYAENTSINAIEVYKHLNQISEPPFTAFVKLDT